MVQIRFAADRTSSRRNHTGRQNIIHGIQVTTQVTLNSKHAAPDGPLPHSHLIKIARIVERHKFVLHVIQHSEKGAKTGRQSLFSQPEMHHAVQFQLRAMRLSLLQRLHSSNKLHRHLTSQMFQNPVVCTQNCTNPDDGHKKFVQVLEKNSRGTRDASERKFFHSIPASQESCTPPTSRKQRSHWPQFGTIHHLWNANETSTESPPRSSSGHLTQSPDLQWARTILRRNRFQTHRQNQRQNQKPNDRKRQSPTPRSTSDLRNPESSAVNWPTLKQHAIADRR